MEGGRGQLGVGGLAIFGNFLDGFINNAKNVFKVFVFHYVWTVISFFEIFIPHIEGGGQRGVRGLAIVIFDSFFHIYQMATPYVGRWGRTP